MAGTRDFHATPQKLTTAHRLRPLLLAVIAAVLIGVGAGEAYAQSASCAGLFNTLRTLERNSEFREYRSSAGDLKDVQQYEQQLESRYIRQGCNAAAKARQPLTSQCRALARDITQNRKLLAQLQQSVETGSAIAQQREAVLQEIARFDCGNGSSGQTEAAQPRGNLFDQLFDMFGTEDTQEDVRGEDFTGYGGYQTVRTVCVRTCDGYFWPVSYSTLPEYAGNDAAQCAQQCPGTDVQLYYYNNPGQEPEQMVSLYGQAYTELPNAFRYRKEFDAGCACKAPVNYGSINLTAASSGQSRAVIQFGEASFPLPIRDPRRPASVVQPAAVDVAAAYVSVPLPRRRPPAPGETPPPVPVAPVAAVPEQRIVKFGDKTVRIVGPDTPYAPTAQAGT